MAWQTSGSINKGNAEEFICWSPRTIDSHLLMMSSIFYGLVSHLGNQRRWSSCLRRLLGGIQQFSAESLRELGCWFGMATSYYNGINNKSGSEEEKSAAKACRSGPSNWNNRESLDVIIYWCVDLWGCLKLGEQLQVVFSVEGCNKQYTKSSTRSARCTKFIPTQHISRR